MDAITLLRNDHKSVEQLFKRFEKAGDGALVEKRQIVDRIVEELSIHATIDSSRWAPWRCAPAKFSLTTVSTR